MSETEKSDLEQAKELIAQEKTRRLQEFQAGVETLMQEKRCQIQIQLSLQGDRIIASLQAVALE